MSSAVVFPEELLRRPTALIMLSGLEVKSNDIHRRIWDTFNNRSSDLRPSPLAFKLVDSNFEVPKCKTKRNSYEWYKTKGILKTHWMEKHLNQIPAVVAIFFHLNWDEAGESRVREKQAECAAKVEHIRQTLQGQQTKVVVVLIQRSTPLPSCEDSIATDYATQLCEACDINHKTLFVLPSPSGGGGASADNSRELEGYIKRLENALWELAQQYYQQQTRAVKSHKDHLNKTYHALLFVRHAFKIAFFFELKQDTTSALKNYKQSYTYLIEGTRVHDTNLLEIKTVGGFINYKICKLSFQHNQPTEAITQFKRHVDWFKRLQGPPELLFEHLAWLSKQFSIFAELFEEAVALGLQAIQTQHPGFYYQQAAYFTMQRRQHALHLCSSNLQQSSGPLPACFENKQVPDVEFWGQRAWRPGIQSIDPPDTALERSGVRWLQGQELLVNYSTIVIPLLNSAVGQYKKFKCGRMRRWCVVMTGEEYTHSHEHSKALKYFLKVLPEYRAEGWTDLFSSVLAMALNAAFLIADVDSFTALIIEMLGSYCTAPVEHKRQAQLSLQQVFSNTAPLPPASLNCALPDDQNDANVAARMWQDIQTAPDHHTKPPFEIQMDAITSFISIEAVFTQDVFPADEPIVVKVFIHSSAELPVQFTRLAVQFNNPAYDPYCVLSRHHTSPAPDVCEQRCERSDAIDSSLHRLSPSQKRALETQLPQLDVSLDELRVVTFRFFCDKADVGRKFEIKSVSLQLGSSGTVAQLVWSGSGSSMTLLDQVRSVNELRLPMTIAEVEANPKSRRIVDLPKRPVCFVGPRRSRVSIHLTHQPPALVNEWYRLEIAIENNEEQPITDVAIAIKFIDKQDQTQPPAQISLDWPAADDDLKISHINRDHSEPIAPGDRVHLSIFLRAAAHNTENLLIKVAHEVVVTRQEGELKLSCSCSHDETVSLPVVRPFDTLSRVATMTMEPLETIHGQEKFLVCTELTGTSPWPIDIQSATFVLNDQVEKLEETGDALTGVTLSPWEAANLMCVARTRPMTLPSTLSLGFLVVRWRRAGGNHGDSLPLVVTECDMCPQHNIDPVPISIRADLPPFGHVQQPMHVMYHVTNHTHQLQEMQLVVDSPDDHIIFSGNKLIHFRILPGHTRTVNYTLIPIAVGFCKLPSFNMYLNRMNKDMTKLVKQLTPRELFVKPAHTFVQPPAPAAAAVPAI